MNQEMVGFEINRAPLEYWNRRHYTEEDVFGVCRDIDSSYMAVALNFSGDGGLHARLTKCTWERQQGHYPTLIDFFIAVAQSPEMQGLRGSLIVWLEDGFWDEHLAFARRAPMLSFGRHIHDHYSFVMPDPAFIETFGYNEDLSKADGIPWSERKPAVFWRGAASGSGMEASEWRSAPRGRLAVLSNEIADSEILDAAITRISHLTDEQQAILIDAGVMKEPVPFEEFLKYRYTVDIDGYCCAWKSLFLKLASGSLVLKMQSDYVQWYFRDLVPWKHYIPLRANLSDFHDVYAWLRAHDEQARAISHNAGSLMRDVVTYEASKRATIEICRQILSRVQA